MAFDPKMLPVKVYEAFNLGPGAWPLVVERAIEAKITSADKIANMVFYMHHPERLGRPLASDETKLIDEWKAFRTLVKPRVDAAAETLSGLATGKRAHKPSEYILIVEESLKL